MFDFKTDTIREKCETGLENAKSAVAVSKDITVRPKLDMGLEINSKKQHKNLFGFQFHFDKEFSLFNIVLTAVAVMAALGALSAALDCLFGSSCKDGEDED